MIDQKGEDLDIVLFDSNGNLDESADFEVLLEQDAFNFMNGFAQIDHSRELAGIILGSYEKQGEKTVIHVKAAVEAKYTEAAKTTVKFTHETWDYINEIKEKHFQELKIVGWFHTHPGFGIFLSEYDTFIHRNFFNLAWQVAFVLDPVANTNGFFNWQGEEIKPCGYKIVDNQSANGGYTLSLPQKDRKGPLSNRKQDRGKGISMLLLAGIFGAMSVAGGAYYLGWSQGREAANIEPTTEITSSQGKQPSNSQLTETKVIYKNRVIYEERIIYKHLVTKGDNLWDISQLYYGDGHQFLKIAKYNQLEDRDHLYPGQILLIPGEEGEKNE